MREEKKIIYKLRFLVLLFSCNHKTYLNESTNYLGSVFW